MLISGWFSSNIISWLIGLDGIIYNLIRGVYRIFIALAGARNFFSEDKYNGIVHKIYLVLGVVMLFFLAYSLLKAVIDPDKNSKGEESFPNIIKNVILSLIIIIALPFIFRVSFNIQNVILNNDIIGRIILSDTEKAKTEEGRAEIINDGGTNIATNTFYAFFHPNSDYCKGYATLKDCERDIPANAAWWDFLRVEESAQINFQEEWTNVENGASFTRLAAFSDAADGKQIDYKYIVSTLVGVLLLLTLLSYCVDMGIRVVKLAFYQIIAPIPVICRIIPKQKKVFDNWLKNTTSTFLEVFVRLAIMYLGVYIIKLITDLSFSDLNIEGLSGVEWLLAEAFLIVGVVLFIKQAPKLLKDVFGFELGGLSPLSRILGMTTAARAGLQGGVRNFTKGLMGGKGFLRSAASGLAGSTSGMVRGYKKGSKAKSFKDWNAAKDQAVSEVEAKKKQRAQYKATHGGTLLGALGGHIEDMGSKYLGLGTEQYDSIIDSTSKVNSAYDALKGESEKFVTKFGTDERIVADMTVEKFKDNDAVFQLYDKYYKGLSLNAMDARITQRKQEIQNMTAADYEREVNPEGVELTSDDLKTKVDELKKKYAQEVANLDFMSKMTHDETVKDVINAAANDGNLGGNDFSEHLYDVKQKAQTFETTVDKNMGPVVVNPATGAAIKKDEYSRDNIGCYYDEVNKAAQRQFSEATNKRQEYIEQNQNTNNK